MNLYVFAIGGSGSRVLRSLTMLLAAGAQTDSNIIPIIIDPDTSNGDLDRTVCGLRQYEEVRGELSFNNTFENRFFSTVITSLSNDGNYFGRLSPDGSVLSVTNGKIGYLKSNGSYVNTQNKVSGYVLEEVAQNRRN